MIKLIHRFRSLAIAVVALALSAGLAFGAMPDAATWGLSNAATHAGKVVPVQAGDEDTSEDQDTDEDDPDEDDTDEDTAEDTESAESAEDAGENCLTDPSALTPEQLAEMRHGSIVCWAAHQTEWPAWFSNHGSFVRCWAHQGKEDAINCAEDPAAAEPAAADAANAHGKGKGNGKGHNK